jgi:hypothetical protein
MKDAMNNLTDTIDNLIIDERIQEVKITLPDGTYFTKRGNVNGVRTTKPQPKDPLRNELSEEIAAIIEEYRDRQYDGEFWTSDHWAERIMDEVVDRLIVDLEARRISLPYAGEVS